MTEPIQITLYQLNQFERNTRIYKSVNEKFSSLPSQQKSSQSSGAGGPIKSFGICYCMINFGKSIPNGPFRHGWEMGILDNKLKDVLSSEWCSIYTTMTVKYLWNRLQNSSSEFELLEGRINNWMMDSMIGQAFLFSQAYSICLYQVGSVKKLVQIATEKGKRKKRDKMAKKGESGF